jgi:hypothetical protein
MQLPETTNSRADLLKSVWEQIRTRLEGARSRIYEEIRNYPRPIPACDQQFNYLLEERARVCGELDRVDEVLREGLWRSDPVQRIEAFLQSSGCIDSGAQQAIRSSLKEAFSGPVA